LKELLNYPHEAEWKRGTASNINTKIYNYVENPIFLLPYGSSVTAKPAVK
jgi:hypothetical protein